MASRMSYAARALVMMAGIGMLLSTGCGPAPAPATPAAPPKKRTPAPVAPAKPATTLSPTTYADVNAAVAALSKAAETSDSEERRQAHGWLVMQGRSAVEPRAAIYRSDDASLESRVAAVKVLHMLGPSAKPVMLEMIDHPTKLIWQNAIIGLGAIKPADKETVDKLIELIHHPEGEIRLQAMKSLGMIGTPAEAATEPLLAILNNLEEEEIFRDYAKDALTKVNPRRKFSD